MTSMCFQYFLSDKVKNNEKVSKWHYKVAYDQFATLRLFCLATNLVTKQPLTWRHKWMRSL